MKKLLLFPALLCASSLFAQTVIDTLAFQDFEVAPAAPVWSFTGPVIYNSGFSAANAAPPNSPIGIGGSRAWETTTNSGGLVLDFANTIIPVGYDSVRVRFNLAAMNLGGSSGGPDNLDYVLMAYSTDGGTTYSNRIRIRGAVNDNCFWAYSATAVGQAYYLPAAEQMFQPITSGLQTTLGYSTVELVFPGTVAQIAIRITGRSSSSSDTWLVDNLVMTGEFSCSNTTSTINASTCNSYTSPSGNTHTQSGTYMDTIPNVGGCDSVITINLNIINTTTSSLAASACYSYISPNGDTLTASGTYADTTTNVQGCDSIITISLTIFGSSASTQSITACDSFVSPSGNTLTISGTYMDTLSTVNGCDSIITTQLTINTVDVSTTLVGATLSSNASGATYQWIDCNNGNSPIVGETNQAFSPAVNGNYAVIVTQNSCTDTSACTMVLSVGLAEANTEFLVSPNPGPGLLNITGQFANASVTIADVQGKICFSERCVNGGLLNVDITALPAGVYILQIVNGDESSQIRIVKY